MTKNSIICPACGSSDIKRHKENKTDQLTLGADFTFVEIYYKCNTCDEETDILSETDKNYLAAQKTAQVEFVKQSIEHLNNSNMSMAMLERVFELPPRTLTRWKKGDFSASTLALLRIILSYAWIVEVAANKFEKKFKNAALIKAAIDEFTQQANQYSKE